MRPLERIDAALWHTYAAAKAEWDALDKETKRATPPPPQVRIKLDDVTIEAAQEILRDSPDGVLYHRDELSGFFGSIDKYAGHRGAANDRGFWLQAYNGGPYTFDRIKRGSGRIEHLSVSVLGGIQPEPMRKLAADTIDDGLIQRLVTIMLQPGGIGRDEELSSAVENYESLVEQLHQMQIGDVALDDAARELREELERKQHDELPAIELINKKLAAHFGKYDGIFARLCLLWHGIENPHTAVPPQVGAACARRVTDFLSRFLARHAIAFYTNIYGLSDDHDRLAAVAGYILAHKVERLTNRVIQRRQHNAWAETPRYREYLPPTRRARVGYGSAAEARQRPAALGREPGSPSHLPKTHKAGNGATPAVARNHPRENPTGRGRHMTRDSDRIFAALPDLYPDQHLEISRSWIVTRVQELKFECNAL